MLSSSFMISPTKNLSQLLYATATYCPMLVSYKNINFKFIHTVIDHKVYWICSVKSTLFVLPFLTPTIICWFPSLVYETKFLLLLFTRFSSLPDLP